MQPRFAFTILSIIWASYYQLARFIPSYQLKVVPEFPSLSQTRLSYWFSCE